MCSLFVAQEIELSEALCGFSRVIKTLDSREIVITSHPGDVIKHGTCDCMEQAVIEP